MPPKPLRTCDLARAAGVHPNTVRRYVDWGLLPPVERAPNGYRQFTQHHLNCLRLARLIYAAEYPGRALRDAANEIIRRAKEGDWPGALEQAQAYQAAVAAELARANEAAGLLERWAQTTPDAAPGADYSIGEAARRMGISVDRLRNWERDGLIAIRRAEGNNYRRFTPADLERLVIIRMLHLAGYSHMAILRMFTELDGGSTRDLRQALDTPRPGEDIFTTADHWLTTLQAHAALAQRIIGYVEQVRGSEP